MIYRVRQLKSWFGFPRSIHAFFLRNLAFWVFADIDFDPSVVASVILYDNVGGESLGHPNPDQSGVLLRCLKFDAFLLLQGQFVEAIGTPPHQEP